MNFRDWLMQEMPINKFQLMGNWGATDKNRGYNAQDIGILTSPKAVDKIHRQWSNTENKFDFYFLRSPKAYKYNQVGKVSQEWVKEHLGIDIEPNPDSITVIFTNNKGTEKIPMTAWMIAHRLGHAIAGQYSSEFNALREFASEVESDFKRLATELYKLQPPRSEPFTYGSRPIDLRPLAYAVGTMKSAANRQLVSFYEFVYEILAQYIITGGVKFNDLPRNLILKNKMAWGRPAPETTWARDNLEGWNNKLHQYAEKYERWLQVIFDDLEGEMLVM